MPKLYLFTQKSETFLCSGHHPLHKPLPLYGGNTPIFNCPLHPDPGYVTVHKSPSYHLPKAVLSNLFDTAGHLVNFPPAGGPQSRGPWRARGARAYKGGLGAEPPAGFRSRAPGWRVRGQRPPEAETLFASECSMETANSPIFLKFGNAKDHQTLLNFAS